MLARSCHREGGGDLQRTRLPNPLSPARHFGGLSFDATTCTSWTPIGVSPVHRLLAALVFVGTPGAALADSCDGLSYQRNSIYKEAGYCFKTARQINVFGNAGCQYDDQADVPLSVRQRGLVAEIVREERMMGCR